MPGTWWRCSRAATATRALRGENADSPTCGISSSRRRPRRPPLPRVHYYLDLARTRYRPHGVAELKPVVVVIERMLVAAACAATAAAARGRAVLLELVVEGAASTLAAARRKEGRHTACNRNQSQVHTPIRGKF